MKLMTSFTDTVIAMDSKDFRGALEILETLAPANDEERATVIFYRAWCREILHDEDTEELVSCYEEAATLARDPILGANASFRAGWLLLNAGEQRRADSAFARSTDRLSAAGIENDLFCHAAYWQAVGWERSGRFLDAVELYGKVAVLNALLRPECVYRQIQCLTAVGALNEALSVCEKAEALLAEDQQPRAAELRRLITQEHKNLRAAMDAA